MTKTEKKGFLVLFLNRKNSSKKKPTLLSLEGMKSAGKGPSTQLDLEDGSSDLNLSFLSRFCLEILAIIPAIIDQTARCFILNNTKECIFA